MQIFRKTWFLNVTYIFSRCIGGLCAVTPCQLETKYCLFKTHKHIFWGFKQVIWCHLPGSIAVSEPQVGPVPTWGCKSPQELTVTKYALTAANELRCPHHLDQKCWKPGSPLGTLPTQTCSCSPTPAAFFALCKPLQCLQSVGRDQKCSHTIFTVVNQHYQIHTYWQTQSNGAECNASEFQISLIKSLCYFSYQEVYEKLPEGFCILLRQPLVSSLFYIFSR